MSDIDESGIKELLDRQKCYDVLTRYCRALDRADIDLMRTVYWDDAVDDHGVFDGNAQAFSEFIVKEIQNWFEVTTHSISNVHMEYHGDTMFTESYLTAYHKVSGSRDKVEAIQGPTYLSKLDPEALNAPHHVFIFGGRYIDRLEKRNGEWRIAMRQVCMDWNENWPGNSIYDEGMFSQLQRLGCRGHEDPVYRNTPKLKS